MDESEQLKFHFVAALRFGSTKSGYAFSSHEEFLKGWPLQINADLWNAGPLLRCIKMPTSLLLNPDESFNSFGYDAENNFTDLVEEGDHREYFYFEKFTKNLYKQIPMLSDYTGKKLATKTVFSESLRFFKNEVLARLNEAHREVTINDVKFVFILPPTWDNQNEEFIKDAAVSAGIDSEQITVALKKNILPVYLPHLIGPIKQHLAEDDELVKSLSQIMLVDVGGQRTEISVIEQPLKVDNMHAGPVVFGPYGGKRIDDEFRRFFEEVWPGTTLEELKEKSLEDYIELFKEFELKKCMMTVTEPRNVSITLPISLVELIQKSTEGMTVNEWLENSPYPEVQLRRSQHLQIPSQVLEKLFQPTIHKILNLMKKVLNEEKYGDVKTIVMTGGFSKCSYLQRAVIAHFQSKSLIIPRNPDLVILEGSVVYGYSNSEVEDKEEIIKETMVEDKLIILYDVKKETTEEEETTDGEDESDQKEPVVSLFEYMKQKEEEEKQQHQKEGNVTPAVTQTFEQQVIQAQKIIKMKPKEIKKIQDKIKQKYEYDKHGETEITSELLDEGIGVNQKNKLSFKEVLEETIELDNREINAMILAAKQGNWNFVWNTLGKKPFLVNCIPEQRTWSALHQAIFQGRLDAVKRLVEDYEADITIRTKPGIAHAAKPGTDALTLAKELEKKEVYDYLLHYTVKKKDAVKGQDISFFQENTKGSVYPSRNYPLFQLTLASNTSLISPGHSNKSDQANHLVHILHDVFAHSFKEWEDVKLVIYNTLYGLNRKESEFLKAATDRTEFYRRVINVYTSETDIYQNLTSALMKPLSPFKPLANDLAVGPFAIMLSAVLFEWNELKPFQGITYRGVSVDVTSKFEIGKEFLFSHFINSSKERTVAEAFRQKSGTLFIFDNGESSKWGPREIQDFSQYAYGAECLYPLGAEFEVVSVNEKTREVHLKLVSPSV